MDFEENCNSKAAEQKRQNLLRQQKLAQKNVQKSGKQQHNRLKFGGFEFALQLSEWLAWPPTDLERWMLVPCPRGLRCLVVAQHERTEIYTKTGRRVCTFRSNLPGDRFDAHTITALDCVYDSNSNIIYVLDALHYGIQNLMLCSADFRYYWLKSNLQNIAENEQNNKTFVLTPHYDCDNEELLSEAFMLFPHFPEHNAELDGFLFYHKDAHYTCGITPLVGWLFPFMVPDVLGYKVNAQYKTPPEYKTPLQYIASFDAKQAIKNYKQVQRLQGKHDKDAAAMELEELTALRKRKIATYDDDDDEPDIFYIASEDEQEQTEH